MRRHTYHLLGMQGVLVCVASILFCLLDCVVRRAHSSPSARALVAGYLFMCITVHRCNATLAPSLSTDYRAMDVRSGGEAMAFVANCTNLARIESRDNDVV